MSEKRPDIQWVDEQWPPQGKIDAGPVVQALAAAKPEAILNVTFGADLVKFVREGNTRGLFKDRAVVSFLTGEPEYLDPLKEETPEGWIVTGYPWYSIKTPEHDAFLKAYQAKYNDYPRLGSIVGYQTIKSAAAILAKANSTDPEKLIAAAEGLSVPSPFGEITFRKIDHQSTLGAFVGKTALKDGKGIMVDIGLSQGLGLSAERCRSRKAAAEGVRPCCQLVATRLVACDAHRRCTAGAPRSTRTADSPRRSGSRAMLASPSGDDDLAAMRGEADRSASADRIWPFTSSSS